MPHPALKAKSAGILVPVFSLRTGRDLGIGEYLDVLPFIDWMKDKGLRLFNILPLNETILDNGCPYTALTAFALDPILLSLYALEDVKKSPQARKLLESPTAKKKTDAWRAAAQVQYWAIRQFKFKVLEKAFERFESRDWDKGTARAKEFKSFISAHKAWLDDYAVFRTLKEKYEWESWTCWPEALKKKEPAAVAAFKKKRARRLLFFKYLQWLCFGQWRQVRAHAAAKRVRLLGDLAFLVEGESADVWSRQDEFSRTATVGAPPDMFNPDGQRWGVPAYNWDRLEATDFAWWRQRLRQAGELYDLFRIDHVVGFFRMYCFPEGGRPAFDPPDEPSQEARGAAFLRLAKEDAGTAYPVAEDLGVIPDFVRKAMAELKIPGYKVLRWEKRGVSFADPQDYPLLSLGVPGTHDTSTLATWWEELPDGERWHLLSMCHKRRWEGPFPPFPEVLTAVQDQLLQAGSVAVLLPIQDVFGWKGQINSPGTIGPHNWTWRMPVAVETLDSDPSLRHRGELLRELVRRTGR